MVELTREAHDDLIELVQDMVEYWCDEQMKQGRPVSGTTAWKVIGCYSNLKEIVMEMADR